MHFFLFLHYILTLFFHIAFFIHIILFLLSISITPYCHLFPSHLLLPIATNFHHVYCHHPSHLLPPIAANFHHTYCHLLPPNFHYAYCRQFSLCLLPPISTTSIAIY